jgi:hypothetical protein
MNKSTKRRLIEQRRRKLAVARGSHALHGGAATTVFSSELTLDHGYASDASLKELEQYFDDASRMLGAGEARDD